MDFPLVDPIVVLWRRFKHYEYGGTWDGCVRILGEIGEYARTSANLMHVWGRNDHEIYCEKNTTRYY
jgi:hypothetical protein